MRGDPWVNGLPESERARGQEPADKAENGEKTLKLLLGETRVTWRKLHGLTSNTHRSLEGLWRQRLTARWTRRPGERTAWATSAGPAPRMRAGKTLVDRLPHARTCCQSALRDGLKDARLRVPECS